MPANSKEYDREWREKNPEKSKAISNRYCRSEKGKKCREEYRRKNGSVLYLRHKEKAKKWKDNNREKMCFYWRKRQYLKKSDNGFHTFEEWEATKNRYNYMCLCCKKFEPEIKLTEDHIIPLSIGGTNNIDNIQPLCMKCNRRKFIKIKDYRNETYS